METKGNYNIFETDDEFTDFCVAPDAAGFIVENSVMGLTSVQFKQPWEKNYSEMYLHCLKEGKTFVIKEKNSKVCNRGVVCKRVPVLHNGIPLRGNGQTTIIQLSVENVEEYDDIFYILKKLDTTDSYNFDTSIDALKNSSMFHMSLGSKELFHSNFLHWLSIVDTKAFLYTMRALAGLKEKDIFWWENEEFKICREYNHYDLSIYIKAMERTKRKDKTVSGNDNGQKEDVWIPVLILENKMKSLPYQDQLDGYLGKAFEEWHKVYKKIDDWQAKGITFILLSLIPPLGINESTHPCSEKRNTKREVKSKWIINDYNKLQEVLLRCGFKGKGKYDKALLNDYCTFVSNLYKIAANDWTVNETDLYLSKVCPKKLDSSKIEYVNNKQLEELRIADIKEKICYDQLLNLLLGKLKKHKIETTRVTKGSFSDENNIGKFLCRTNYFHNVGLFEVIFMLDNKKGKDDNPFFLTIQIQGNYYTHGISGKNIVKTEYKNDIDKKVNVIGDFFNDKNDWKSKLKFFFDFDRDPTDPQKFRHYFYKPLKSKEKEEAYYKYDTTFVYQCAEIPQDMTIKKLLEIIVTETEDIKKQNLTFR